MSRVSLRCLIPQALEYLLCPLSSLIQHALYPTDVIVQLVHKLCIHRSGKSHRLWNRSVIPCRYNPVFVNTSTWPLIYYVVIQSNHHATVRARKMTASVTCSNEEVAKPIKEASLDDTIHCTAHFIVCGKLVQWKWFPYPWKSCFKTVIAGFPTCSTKA